MSYTGYYTVILLQVHKLEIEYAAKYGPLYKRRALIVSGELEPSPSECAAHGEDNEKSDNETQVTEGLMWGTYFRGLVTFVLIREYFSCNFFRSHRKLRVTKY